MADNYWRFQVTGLTAGAGNTLMQQLRTLSFSGINMSMVWVPATGTFTIEMGGEDLSTALSSLRTQIQTRVGRVADVDTTIDISQAGLRTARDRNI